MNIFEETMKHFDLESFKPTKEQKEELKRDVEFEKWLDEKEKKEQQKEREV